MRHVLPILLCLATPALADSVKELPLKRGFYVSSDTPCGEASNGSLSLVTRKGINYPQAECTISSINQTGPTRFDVTDNCVEIASGDSMGDNTQTYDIPNETSYSLISDGATMGGSRYCAQNELPEPWSHNDIADMIK